MKVAVDKRYQLDGLGLARSPTGRTECALLGCVTSCPSCGEAQELATLRSALLGVAGQACVKLFGLALYRAVEQHGTAGVGNCNYSFKRG